MAKNSQQDAPTYRGVIGPDPWEGIGRAEGQKRVHGITGSRDTFVGLRITLFFVVFSDTRTQKHGNCINILSRLRIT